VAPSPGRRLQAHPEEELDVTRVRFRCQEMLRLDCHRGDQVVVLQDGVEGSHEQFYKSMTSLADHRIWQDVYQVPFEGLIVYVKFTTDAQGYLVISFKEK
jgi:Motility quorum-sensing regulator, toxin of MqsA